MSATGIKTRTSLQSAADAGALAAANAQINFNTVTSQQLAEPFALTAANNATNNQFNLTAATLTVTPTTATVNGAAATAWQATATAPRGSFFSPVKGWPFRPAPRQPTATATADYVSGTASDCLITKGSINTESGHAEVEGSNCGILDESTTSCSINAQNGTSIIGSTIGTNRRHRHRLRQQQRRLRRHHCRR